MNGGWLLLPFFLVRFALLGWLNREAVRHAARFAPMTGLTRIAYWIYQLSSACLMLTPFFLDIQTRPLWRLAAGTGIYILGLGLLVGAVVSFAMPSGGGLCQEGAYRWSRNPMYVAYFALFAGCVLLTGSLVLLGVLLAFQVSAHWIILAEEQWCLETFGEAYRRYMGHVRRYF